MKPSISVWTTSQLDYDQRIQRMVSAMKSVGFEVNVWDRKTMNYPHGVIGTRWSAGPGMYLDFNRQIAILASKEKADVVYAADIDVMPGLLWGLKSRKNSPLILDLHEWFPEVIELKSKPMRKWVWQLIERKSIAFATERLTVNDSLKNIFSQKYGKEFTVVRNVPELRPANSESAVKRLNNKILYYQGALNEGRGLPIAIEALRLLPGWRLWLVGEGRYESGYECECECGCGCGSVGESVHDRVVYYGRKHPEELRELASQATVGLNLLRKDSKSYYYSLANRYFDYIHADLPAIHMDFPEYKNLLQEYKVGITISELTPEVVANAVRSVTEDEQNYIQITNQCSAAKKEYNWQNESKKLNDLLNKLSHKIRASNF